MDESYIKEILDHVAKLKQQPRTEQEFLDLCRMDIQQGYRIEAQGACQRFFNKSGE